jgi:penicillin-binding protein 1A
MLRFISYLFGAGCILFFAGIAVVSYVVWDVAKDLPNYDALAKYEPPVMTRVHAGDGQLLAEYARERRLYVPINAVPDLMIRAILSAEDKNFFEHNGIDIQGIFRAVLTNVRNANSSKRLVGASTITQQVAKNFLLSSDRTIERKLKEALLALRIEQAFSKDQILELYLNKIYLGLGSYGVAAASLNYFSKPLDQLSIAQIAYLAALPKAPSNYHPFKQTKRALARRNWVIERMMENGYITEQQAEAEKATGLEVSLRPYGARLFAADSFAEEVRRRIIKLFGENKLYDGGLSVRTTLNPKMQVWARNALVDGLVAYDRRKGWRGAVANINYQGDWGTKVSKIKAISDIAPWRLAVVLEISDKQAKIGLQPTRLENGDLSKERLTAEIPLKEMLWARKEISSKKGGWVGEKIKKTSDVLKLGDVVYVAPVEKNKTQWRLMQVPKVDGGIVALDPHTGRIYALVGGFSYASSQFNRAVQAERQPGSSFKPFVYAAALEQGYTPSSLVMDAPLAVDQGGALGVWQPKNYGGKFSGPSTLRKGIERSRNVMTVRLAQDIGMETVADYSRRFGIYDNLPQVLSMSLGAGETTLLKMTAGFGMLVNGGKKITPTLIDRVQDRYGRTIYRHDNRPCNQCTATSWQGQEEPELIDIREKVLDPLTAYQITSMLEGVVQRGTGSAVKVVGKPLGGKTGTTNDEKDAWFVGFSPDLAVGVFIGFDNPKSMGRGATGGQLAAPVFRDFMIKALAGKPGSPFRIPDGINLIPINVDTGQMAALGEEGVILEAFKPGTQPGFDNVILGSEEFEGEQPSDVFTAGTGGLY